MTTTHTPGPWSLFQQGDEYGCWGGAGERVFSIRGGVLSADARLIAAAPEMLAEIRRLVDTCERGFRQLGMDGPDRERMGKVWFATYERFCALLARIAP